MWKGMDQKKGQKIADEIEKAKNNISKKRNQ